MGSALVALDAAAQLLDQTGASAGGRTVAEVWAELADAFELLSDIDGSLRAHRQAVMALLKSPHFSS